MGFFDSLTELADEAKSAVNVTGYDDNKAATIAGKANMSSSHVVVDINNIDPSELEGNKMRRTGNVGADIASMEAHNKALIEGPNGFKKAVENLDKASQFLNDTKLERVKAEKQLIDANTKRAHQNEHAKLTARDYESEYKSDQKKRSEAGNRHGRLFDKLKQNVENAKDNRDKITEKEV